MALTSGRNTVEIEGGEMLYIPVKGGSKIYDGSIVMIDGGYAIPGQKKSDLIAAGRAEEYVDNTGGADGDVCINVKRGVFKYTNDTTNPVTQADILKECYVLDDETVSMLETDSSIAGKVLRLEDDEVIIEIR